MRNFDLSEYGFGVAIFPCLKTSNSISIGNYKFRSTNDVSGLPENQALAVRELANMLYARDDVRIASASYTITEPLDMFFPGPVIARLDRVRAVVGYLYSATHPIFGATFMPFEFASMAVVQPAKIATFNVRPHYGTILPPLPEGFKVDEFHATLGYEGYYNRRPIWLAKGSRLYGGHTYTPLNNNQDLFIDIEQYHEDSQNHSLLLELLNKPETEFGDRIFTALDWYNDANDQYAEPAKRLLSLGVAFEVLLALPANEKTDRLSDGISLLLGRTARVKEWAAQFYAARSQVAHEGRVRDWSFYSSKEGQTRHRFGSVMTYGVEVFQLCMATILTGGWLAEQSGLAERFVANSERYAQISERLGRLAGDPVEAIASIKPLVEELDKYQFISGPTPIKDIIKAIQNAAKALHLCRFNISNELDLYLKDTYLKQRGDEFSTLCAIESLEAQLKNVDLDAIDPAAQVIRRLVDIGWRGLFITFENMKNQHMKKDEGIT